MTIEERQSSKIVSEKDEEFSEDVKMAR